MTAETAARKRHEQAKARPADPLTPTCLHLNEVDGLCAVCDVRVFKHTFPLTTDRRITN